MVPQRGFLSPFHSQEWFSTVLLLCVLSGTFHEAHEALALGVKGYMKELSVRVVRVAGKGYVTIT